MDTRHGLSRAKLAGILVLALLLSAAPLAVAAPGDLDPSFDGDGMVTTDISGNDHGTAIALDSAGRILVAGSSTSYSDRFTVVRFNPDGTLDASFSDDGKSVISIGDQPYSWAAMALDSSGRIVLAGATRESGTADFSVVRLQSNGSLDPTFDGDGQATTDFASSPDWAWAVEIDGNQRIVVAGESQPGSDPLDFALARYNSDGSLDSSFSGDGRVTTDFAGSSDSAYAVALTGDGRIIAAGRGAAPGYDFGLARYLPNGSLDTTFSGDGTVTTDFDGQKDEARAIVVDGSGRVLVAGYAKIGDDYDFALARYTVNGALDPTFGIGGRVTTDFSDDGNDYGYSVTLDGAGRILVAGTSRGVLALARYTTDGALDPGFGLAGRVVTGFGEATSLGGAITVDSAQRIVVAGTSGLGADHDFAVARYLGGNPSTTAGPGALDPTFDGDGIATTDFFGGTDYGYSVALDSTGRIVVGGYGTSTAAGRDFAIARFNQDGSLDMSFDGDGKATIDISGADDRGRAVAIDSYGRIVLVGSIPSGTAFVRFSPNGTLDTTCDHDGKVNTGWGNSVAVDSADRVLVVGSSGNWPDPSKMAVARYNADCSPDMTFDTDGMTVIEFEGVSASALAVTLDSDGRVILAGQAGGQFAVARLNPNGSPDTSFDADGKVTTSFGGSDDMGWAVALDDAGRIVVAGQSTDNMNWDFAVARYNADGSLDTTFSGDGKVNTDFLGGGDEGYAVAIDDSGHIVVTGITMLGSSGKGGLLRYNPDGSLDTTFGSGGKTFTIGGGNGAVTDASGRVIVSGGKDGDLAVARHLGSAVTPPTDTPTPTATATATATLTATPTATATATATATTTATTTGTVPAPQRKLWLPVIVR